MNFNTSVNQKKKQIKDLLKQSRISEFAKINILYGEEQFEKAKKISNSGDIETMKSADGIYRAKKIFDAFCNNNICSKYGIEVDTYLAKGTKIPILKIGNVIMTIKSVKNINDIKKRPSTYMKELVHYNLKLENQMNMFDVIDKDMDSKNKVFELEKYYGILAYHFDIAGDIEHITMVFYDSKLEKELLIIETPKELLNTKKAIIPKDENTLDNNNIKEENSLKNVLTLKNN